MQQATYSLDLRGVIPNVVHSPTLLAQCQETQATVPLLLDTGLSLKDCAFETAEQINEFNGSEENATVRLGPITAFRQLPPSLRLGVFIPSKDIVTDQLARAIQLSVGKMHVDGVSAQYLVGPHAAEGQILYPNRLVAFWSPQGMPRTTLLLSSKEEDEGQRQEMQELFGQQVSFYAVPIRLVAPGNQAIPSTVTAVTVKVRLSLIVPKNPRYIPISDAQSPQGVSFRCMWDTGASYNIVRREVAKDYGLNYETGAKIVLPQLTILDSNPRLMLQGVPAIVDNTFSDQIILGNHIFDRFRTVVLDFGTTVERVKDDSYTMGVIQLIP